MSKYYLDRTRMDLEDDDRLDLGDPDIIPRTKPLRWRTGPMRMKSAQKLGVNNGRQTMNKDLIDFTDSILGRYNATPDEWDAFESIKWSMNTTHKISAVFFPQRNEVEATWENIATGKRAGATFPVTPDQGEDIAEVLMPCVYQDAACEQRGVRAELKTKPLRWRTGPVPDDFPPDEKVFCVGSCRFQRYYYVTTPRDIGRVIRWLPLSEILDLIE